MFIFILSFLRLGMILGLSLSELVRMRDISFLLRVVLALFFNNTILYVNCEKERTWIFNTFSLLFYIYFE
jgi:hypothetical protein